MVVKNVKEFEKGVLAPGKVLIRAKEKKSSLDLVRPVGSGRADDAMQGTQIEYAEIANANGVARLEEGDIVLLANYSSPSSFAIYDGDEKTGQLYIVMSEHDVYYAVKPENYKYEQVIKTK